MKFKFEHWLFVVCAVIIAAGCHTCKKSWDRVQAKKKIVIHDTVPTQPTKAATPVEAYIIRFRKVAQAEQKKYGIPASITLAQGILESGVGKSRLAAHHNNHFGIKCWCKGKKKDCVNMADDSPRDRFRIYTSAWHSYRHHSIFVKSMPLRTNEKSDYRAWAKALKKAGYATKSSYAQDLIKLIERYNLQKFDDLKNT